MGRIEVRDFDGDLEALAAMTRASFPAEYGNEPWIDLYQPKTARHLFAQVPDPRFLIGAYSDARLVGFVANLPRSYRFNGQIYRGVVTTMLVTELGYPGVAAYLIGECLKRNQDYGADLAVMFFENRHSARLLFDQVLRPRFRIQRLKRLYMLARAIDLGAIVAGENLSSSFALAVRLAGAHRPIGSPCVEGTVRPYAEADLDPILALTRRYSDAGSLVRIFDRDSLAIQLEHKDVASTMVYERDGAVVGFINFAVRDVVTHQESQRWAWVDFLYWQGLSGREKKALLAGLWEASRRRGCIGILEWNKNYYGKGALFRSRFVPFPRYLEMNAWVFDPGLSLEGVDRVFEQVS